jgi:3-isopropylmalate/(R)-2-methylmalate dehydratase small subunit
LKAQRVSRPGDVGYTFDLDPTDKERLLLGLDDIAVTQAHEHNIRRYEIRQKELMPWLFKDI